MYKLWKPVYTREYCKTGRKEQSAFHKIFTISNFKFQTDIPKHDLLFIVFIATKHQTYIYSGYIISIPNIQYKMCFKSNLYNNKNSEEGADIVIFLAYFSLRKKVGSEITTLIVSPLFKLLNESTALHDTRHKRYITGNQ
jgi:hypothetical protein